MLFQLLKLQKSNYVLKAALEAAAERGFPEWLEVDVKALSGTFKAPPQREETCLR